jgi:hypothetical protein
MYLVWTWDAISAGPGPGTPAAGRPVPGQSAQPACPAAVVGNCPHLALTTSILGCSPDRPVAHDHPESQGDSTAPAPERPQVNGVRLLMIAGFLHLL